MTDGPAGSTAVDAPALPTATPRRSPRRPIIWGGVVLGFVLLSAVLGGLTARQGADLDPDNPQANGAQAVARVLEDQGVQVRVARGLDALTGTSTTGATVLVSGTAYLSPPAGRTIVEHTRGAAALLVLDPTGDIGEILDLPVSASRLSTATPLTPGCPLGGWREGDQVQGADTLIEVTDLSVQAEVCLPPSEGFNAGGSRSGHLVHLSASSQRPPTTLLGIGPSMRNDRVTDRANAATWLRLLGARDDLVWYIPAPGDAGDAAPRSLLDVLPAPVVPSAALAVLALAALALVRGRRLGPVVSEPLPVVVRSIETTQSRARLYQSAQDRQRSLAVLQGAARHRWALRLGLSPAIDPAELVRAVSGATGRPADEVTRLLNDPSAADDETLVRTARDLLHLQGRHHPDDHLA